MMPRRAILPMVTAIALASASGAAWAGDYAPLNCHKASSPSEKTICSSYPLGQSEARMATLFSVATSLVAMGQRGDIQDAQRNWLASRDACGKDVGCLDAAYQRRIGALNNVIANIASRGPY
ncbi:lysozyme inhibitor LprI family protein [Hyphomicrobium sp. DY-1]|uniref:lysozyme inhibitor LprI family protein n=1 Tax=Hyphomicrobium sp. DY-1 TaxID=3075650 RepID=UPI0039C4B686